MSYQTEKHVRWMKDPGSAGPSISPEFHACEITPLLPQSTSELFGQKTIGTFASYALLVNNAVGPAILIFPLLNQSAGWSAPIVVSIIVYIVSTFSCTMLCEAIQRIPGNESFGMRIEFCDAVRYYIGDGAYWTSQIFLSLSLQASNIAAMIVSAQTVDNLFKKILGASYALDWMSLSITETNEIGNFETWSVISLGFIFCMLICIPFGYLSLEDNMWFQYVSFFSLMFFTFEFLIQFLINMSHDPQQVEIFVEDSTAQSSVLGTIIFANAFVVTLPSWLNEKKEGVEANGLIWNGLGFATIFRCIVGILGAFAFSMMNPHTGLPNKGSANILNLLAGPGNLQITQYSSLLWDISTIIPGIPVLAVVMKYNLVSGEIMSDRNSFLFSVVLPWVVTMFCYESDLLANMCAWAGLCIQGYINFAVPVYLYILALRNDSSDPRPPFSGAIEALPRCWSLKTKRCVAWSILVFFVTICTGCIVQTILPASNSSS